MAKLHVTDLTSYRSGNTLHLSKWSVVSKIWLLSVKEERDFGEFWENVLWPQRNDFYLFFNESCFIKSGIFHRILSRKLFYVLFCHSEFLRRTENRVLTNYANSNEESLTEQFFEGRGEVGGTIAGLLSGKQMGSMLFIFFRQQAFQEIEVCLYILNLLFEVRHAEVKRLFMALLKSFILWVIISQAFCVVL